VRLAPVAYDRLQLLRDAIDVYGHGLAMLRPRSAQPAGAVRTSRGKHAGGAGGSTAAMSRRPRLTQAAGRKTPHACGWAPCRIRVGPTGHESAASLRRAGAPTERIEF
jgi:hypothetical protein